MAELQLIFFNASGGRAFIVGADNKEFGKIIVGEKAEGSLRLAENKGTFAVWDKDKEQTYEHQ